MAQNNVGSSYKDNIIAHYRFDDVDNIVKDSAKNANNAEALGMKKPLVSEVDGRLALILCGGDNGTSYLKLPSNLLDEVNDETGLTITTWIYLGKVSSIWERIFDFGTDEFGPGVFLNRNLRGVCVENGELAADSQKTFTTNEWMHIGMSIKGTKGGTLSSAGPVIYVNGEVVANGIISQTSSGTYKKLREWFKTFKNKSNYNNNYIGKSQHKVDADFCGALSDFRIYKSGLTDSEVIEVMCEGVSDEIIVELAKKKYLSLESNIVIDNIELPKLIMGEKVKVTWKSNNKEVITNDGVVSGIKEPIGIKMTAVLSKGNYSAEKNFDLTLLPKSLPAYTLNINGDVEVLDISKTLYGLFYEDINNAADGGIYAELIQNRSFEAFTYDTYSSASGENAISTGRNHNPLFGWFGDTSKVKVNNNDGLNSFFNIQDKEVNAYYVTVEDGAEIYNKGFTDQNNRCCIAVKKDAKYDFTIWAKAEKRGKIIVQLKDEDGKKISNAQIIDVECGNSWGKYGVSTKIALKSSTSTFGQLALTFEGDISIDMVSLIPEDVWGAKEEEKSKTAHLNYKGNPNYRLRKDLVNALIELNPKFLRFPGGCISEGSYIWENVYDWKDSVGAVELRKENFNVWGYMMSMGLGYMEYFQLAEDLNATPLPVMACGVLCQARSDYANPAGGALREKYIKNFIDLIDFAINTDFENNEWAVLRKNMGHEAPFDLHYLGVGNENWGEEFFASFEAFKVAIDEHMKKNYPGYELDIISTVGAQADDDAYQNGWKFLSGNLKGTAKVRFTDGKVSKEEVVDWYKNQKDYMETIADEHYYRSNEYLLNNVDRYNYYYRDYNTDGSLNNKKTSKVFVGEYASTDKNTLAGAVAEAAVMTGFENNSDVVRLAATAPLFNKVRTDNLYRWTPDCIWFDDETVWHTPNYYVQQLFAKYIGTKLLDTSFFTYKRGEFAKLIPSGGIEIATGNGEINVKKVKVISNLDDKVIFEQDFTKKLNSAWHVIPNSVGYSIDSDKGLILKAQSFGLNGLYIMNNKWTNYRVEVEAVKISGLEGFFVGVGLTNILPDEKDVVEYAIGYNGNDTGVKVYKRGIEGYTLGDYSSSTAAGNLRACCFEKLKNNIKYNVTVNYGGNCGENLECFYTDGKTKSKVLNYKLEAYNSEIFNSVTRDKEYIYAKLVNAESISKELKINIKGLDVESIGRKITLTGDSAIVNVPNINKKNDEKVVPNETEIKINKNSSRLSLAPNSVNVVIIKIKH